MALNLPASTLQPIHDMIWSNDLTVCKMTRAASCSECTIRRLCSNWQSYEKHSAQGFASLSGSIDLASTQESTEEASRSLPLSLSS